MFISKLISSVFFVHEEMKSTSLHQIFLCNKLASHNYKFISKNWSRFLSEFKIYIEISGLNRQICVLCLSALL